MLRKIRIGISVVLFALITFYFLDFANILPNSFHRLAHIQFVPAVLSLSIGILIVLIALTLLFDVSIALPSVRWEYGRML